jgi:hypothetical protein
LNAIAIGASGRSGAGGYTPLIATGGVENRCCTSAPSVAPSSARVPAGTVTTKSVACGSRAPVAVNTTTRVSIQRHVPATAGAIVAGGVAGVPTRATATIG